MARAITELENETLRREGQFSRVYLAIHRPAVVFAARINQVFGAWDVIAALNYDNVSAGVYTAIKSGMTVLIGSAAGKDDVGMCRARKAADGTTIYIGATSKIKYMDNQYITVLDQYLLWPKIPVMADNEVRFDYDVVYSDQHTNKKPLPSLGGDAVLWMSSGSALLNKDASASQCLDDNSPTLAFSWTSEGIATLANGNTHQVSVTYLSAQADGKYLDCQVTSSNGGSETGHKLVFVFDSSHGPVEDFEIVNSHCVGELSDGNWSFGVILHDSGDFSNIRHGTQVVLFSVDFYQDQAGNVTAGSIGPVAGSENVICSGWISEESNQLRPGQNMLKFTVNGPAWWLDHITSPAIALANCSGAATSWETMQNLTVDKALWAFFAWRSTASTVLDIKLTGDDRLLPTVDASEGSLWAQFSRVAVKIQAKPACDRFGRLFVEIPASLMATNERASIPVVTTILADDWEEKLDIDYGPDNISMLEISGIAYDGVTQTTLQSQAPGSIIDWGDPDLIDGLLFHDQDQANQMCADIYAWDNRDIDALDVSLAHNNGMIDICPVQRLAIAAETERISLTGRYFQATRVELVIRDGGFRSTNLTVEVETDGDLAITVIPLQPAIDNGETDIPTDINIPQVPTDTWFPPVVHPLDDLGCSSSDVTAPLTGPVTIPFDTQVLTPGGKSKAFLPCAIRGSTATNPTYVDLHLNNFDSAQAPPFDFYACDGNGKRKLTPTQSGLRFTFSPATRTNVSGFVIESKVNVGGTSGGWSFLWIDETSAPWYPFDGGLRTLLNDGGSWCPGDKAFLDLPWVLGGSVIGSDLGSCNANIQFIYGAIPGSGNLLNGGGSVWNYDTKCIYYIHANPHFMAMNTEPSIRSYMISKGITPPEGIIPVQDIYEALRTSVGITPWSNLNHLDTGNIRVAQGIPYPVPGVYSWNGMTFKYPGRWSYGNYSGSNDFSTYDIASSRKWTLYLKSDASPFGNVYPSYVSVNNICGAS